MDEIKNNCEIENALRALAQQRDRRLRAAPMLTPAREELLTECLREEFPLESAFGEAALQRDRLLNQSSELPAPVELALQERIAAHSTSPKSSPPILQRLIRSRFAAAITVCVMITAAVFLYSDRKTLPHRNAQNLKGDEVSFDSRVAEDRWFIGQAELFGRRASIRRFDLNKTEPASLQVSFFTNSEMYFAEGNDVRLGLRLDLPVRAVLVEQDLARTP